MRFYDREQELALLGDMRTASRQESRMMVVYGRRRIGKTSLILKSVEQETFVYLFVSRKNEVLLCKDFIEEIQKSLDVQILGTFTSFAKLFGYLLQLSESRPFTVIVDEFQEFYSINSSVYSELQHFWDRGKQKSKINLILSGSVFSMMKKIFENAREPLFGRADEQIHLKPFSTETLRNIMEENHPAFTNWDLLALYTFTGGVPKYVELLVDKNTLAFEPMIDEIFRENSFWIDEGKNLLVEEMGKEYATYFSILSLLGSGKTSRPEIESILEKNIGGYMDRLIHNYQLIRPLRPMFSKPGSRNLKYVIEDNFLGFWFRFVFKYSSALEINRFSYVKTILKRDFSTFAGRILEKWFRDQMALSGLYTRIGGYWDNRGENEIDIVALDESGKKASLVEVKINKKKANLEILKEKAKKILPGLKDYDISYQIMGLEDM